MIRGAVYPIDLGQEKRGHEQRGNRFGLVVSIQQNHGTVVTVIPTSTSAQSAIYRPEFEIAGEMTKLLVGLGQVYALVACLDGVLRVDGV